MGQLWVGGSMGNPPPQEMSNCGKFMDQENERFPHPEEVPF